MAARARDAPGAGGPGANPAGGTLLLELEFDGGSLHALRQAVQAHAAAAGAPDRDVMMAVHELAANAVWHGAGRGRLRMWGQDAAVCCQVQDAGREPRGGRAGAREETGAGWAYEHGHGLWLVRLLADQMSVTSGPDGTCATARFALR